MKAFLILGSALLVGLLLSFSPMVRAWWKSFFSRPGPAFLLSIALAGTMIGTGEKADLAAIQSGAPDAYRIVRALLAMSLFSLASIGILRDLSKLKLAGNGARWMMVFALVAMLSSAYSVSGFISLWKGFEVLTLVLVIISLAGQLRTIEDLNWLMNIASLMLLYIVLTVYAGVALYPGDAIKDQDYLGVRGLVPGLNPSSVGSISALLAISIAAHLLYKWPSKKTIGNWIVFLIGAGMLILAHSRTPILAFGIATVLILIGGKHYRLAMLTGFVSTGLVFAISIDEILEYVYRGQSQESFEGLSGRRYFWDLVWPTFLSSPILGNGYYATHRELFGVSGVDNSYLEILLGVGIFGLSIFMIPVLLAIKGLLSTRPQNDMQTIHKFLWAQTMGIFLIIVLRGITAPSFQVQHPLLIYYMLTQISVAALLRLRSSNTSETETTTNSDTDDEKPNLLSKKKSSILSRRHR